jgi:hypothetical protein
MLYSFIPFRSCVRTAAYHINTFHIRIDVIRTFYLKANSKPMLFMPPSYIVRCPMMVSFLSFYPSSDPFNSKPFLSNGKIQQECQFQSIPFHLISFSIPLLYLFISSKTQLVLSVFFIMCKYRYFYICICSSQKRKNEKKLE